MSTHDIRPEALPRENPPVSDLAQWTSVLGGPFAALLNLQVNYTMVQWACTSGNAWTLHVVHLVTLLIAVGAGLLGRSLWMRTGGEWPDAGGGSTSRSRFLAAFGALSGVIFALVILAMWVGVIVVGPCPRN